MTGILIIDKPSGWTSFDVVAKLRRVLGERHVGHAGTLDPMATGVLPLLAGRATRALPFLESADKEYLAEVRFGMTTDTEDITGTVLSEGGAMPTERDVQAALAGFLGEREQLPPLYSAVKIGGKKLYEYARAGKNVERKPRRITITEMEPLGFQEDGGYRFRMVCSKGTYVRTVCSELGGILGCGGTMSALRRTRAGRFTLADSVTLEQALAEGPALMRPTDFLFADRPALILDAEQSRRCRCGNPVNLDTEDGEKRLYASDGEFLALAAAEGGVVKTVKSFFEVTGS